MEEVFAPDPDRPVPRDPERLATELVRTTEALRHSIDEWAGPAAAESRPPRHMVLQALYQQRIYRTLARDHRLRDATITLLPKKLRKEAQANSEAAAKLFSLVTPISGGSTFETGKPNPPGVLLGFYQDAERRFGVDWEVLAALHHVESKFSRVKSASTAGAQGPMQFIPSTWAAYGMGGDVHDDHDAIMGAANYLSASGAPGNYRKALYAYNHSWEYVDAVWLYAEQIMGDDRDFYAYYNWQVFVLTTTGDERLTGPGL
jgi:soluble lytic murein transglycosylase-like protein